MLSLVHSGSIHEAANFGLFSGERCTFKLNLIYMHNALSYKRQLAR